MDLGLGATRPLAPRAQLDRMRRIGVLMGYSENGVLALTGFDKRVETFAVAQSPQWQTDITIGF